ncbi:hypothetical protein ACN47E_010244 [Coniothyrium glycines]
MMMNFSLTILRLVDERVQLYNKQGPDNARLHRACLDAARIAIAKGNLVRGRVFAERAVEGWRIAHGADGDDVIEYTPLAENPAKLSLYGISMEWETSLDEVPSGLDSAAFDDWL